jgi:hypothetical protein
MRAIADRSANGSTPGEIAAEFGISVELARSVRTCANPKCGKPFIAGRDDQDYCQNRCKSSHWRLQNRDDPRTVRLRAAMKAFDRFAEVADEDDLLIFNAHMNRTVRAQQRTVRAQQEGEPS